jgi:hypothetical protein
MVFLNLHAYLISDAPIIHFFGFFEDWRLSPCAPVDRPYPRLAISRIVTSLYRSVVKGIVTGILYGVTRSRHSTLLNLVEFVPVIGDFVPAYTISTIVWIYSESKQMQKQAIIQ